MINAHVITRGKFGNAVEFGQGLLLVEQKDGLIVDWELFKAQPPSDSSLLKPTLERIGKYYGAIKSYCADRGFSTKKNDELLQTRRSQTESRIGIFKNVFLGTPLHSRITTYKKMAITWCVLTKVKIGIMGFRTLKLGALLKTSRILLKVR